MLPEKNLRAPSAVVAFLTDEKYPIWTLYRMEQELWKQKS